ncbi:FAD-binding oxidoreductase [Saccharopolyspora rhizosphaerae]|uniref:FAD-binding oxidoreductase n=1 Tax=Saccharopolyspora rhizosphaerae TaxID=2492662 RepID=A0A426JHQ9_9PSEU|nr:FAD-binding oxidoreductase [Saccharopolyspora rhizosphaerae]RRO12683.1 FAD-binding oxidoreductase [Saccharopolyspora rhizosphaerae]
MPTKTTDAAHGALVAALGADHVTVPARDDDPHGIGHSLVAEVAGTEQASAAMKVAAEHDLRVLPKGSGSKLDWGAPPRDVDLLLDVSPANEVVEHAAGDLVVHALAGTPIAEINRTVRAGGQQLAIDQPIESATVGGVIATSTSGPCRHLFGGVRDLLIGITVVLADGTVTTAGGKVVKNVAGYDLCKLYTGSFGTLGVITEAVFRLHPVAAEHRWITVTTDEPAAAAAAADTIRHSQEMPTAIEVDRPTGGPLVVCGQLEGRPSATHARALELAEKIGGEVTDQPPQWWGQHPFTADGTGLRVGAEPVAMASLLTAIEQRSGDLPVTVRGAIGLGVLHLGVPADADPADIARLTADLRDSGTYAVVERAPRAVLDHVDPWGPVAAGPFTLMRRTKDQFDPQHRLAPGRFVGGI